MQPRRLRRATKTGRSTDRLLGRQNRVTPPTPTPTCDARAFGGTLRGERRRRVLCRPPVGPLAAERTQLLQTALGSPRLPNQPPTSSRSSFSFPCLRHWCEDQSAIATRVEIARRLLSAS